jgi:hypothetical protein
MPSTAGAVPEVKAADFKPAIRGKLVERREYITTYGGDVPEIRDGMWTMSNAT